MKAHRALVCLALAAATFALHAEEARARIVFAEGKEVAILDAAGKSRKVYDPAVAGLVGLEVRAGESIMTDARTIVEVKLEPRGDVIRIGKSTWFKIGALSATGGNLFTLEYGKIRSAVKPLTGAASFSVKHESAAAGVRGTEFGMEVVLKPDSGAAARPTLKVYCFEGLVEVTSVAEPPAATESLEPIPIVLRVAPNEMLTMPVTLKEGEKPLKSAIPEDVSGYWKDFSAADEAAAALAKAEAEAKAVAVAKAEAAAKAEAEAIAKAEAAAKAEADAAAKAEAEAIAKAEAETAAKAEAEALAKAEADALAKDVASESAPDAESAAKAADEAPIPSGGFDFSGIKGAIAKKKASEDLESFLLLLSFGLAGGSFTAFILGEDIVGIGIGAAALTFLGIDLIVHYGTVGIAIPLP